MIAPLPSLALVRYGRIPEVARCRFPAELDVRRGARVVVQTHRGLELASVIEMVRRRTEDTEETTPFEVVRLATTDDETTARSRTSRLQQDFEPWQQRMTEWNLDLQLVDLVKVGDRVYYNEACATYSAEAGGRCANVVAVDVGGAVPKVLWRSKALVSNAPIVPVGAGARWLVTGYGFTDERDFLVLLDAERGTVVQKVLVKKAPESIVLAADGTLEVLIYDAEVPTRFELVGLDGKKPKLRPLK